MPEGVKCRVIGSGGIAGRRTIPERILAARSTLPVPACDRNSEANTAVANESGATAASRDDNPRTEFFVTGRDYANLITRVRTTAISR
jgi:hypothetical protein